jgi:hypothetical protein
MSRRLIERGLWSATAVTLSATLLLLHRETSRASAGAPATLPSFVPALERPTVDSLEEAVSDVAEHDLFRPDRSMAPAQEAMPGPALATMTPLVARPRLVLRGVLGGPPWDALVEGLPGRDGAVVMRAGQTIAGITIRSVRPDTVLARGFDTTWALTLGRSW